MTFLGTGRVKTFDRPVDRAFDHRSIRMLATGGGIVFYITEGGVQGYEATRSDSNRTQWGCSRTIITGADGTVISTGQQNTIDIAKECGDDSVATLGSAAAAISNGWVLPSKDELNELFLQKDVWVVLLMLPIGVLRRTILTLHRSSALTVR